MSRTAIYLAGWLTTAVVAAVVIMGMASGVFASAGGQADGSSNQALATQPAGSGRTGNVVYVYPDGSPAPNPADTSTSLGGVQTGYPGYADLTGQDGYDHEAYEHEGGHDREDDD